MCIREKVADESVTKGIRHIQSFNINLCLKEAQPVLGLLYTRVGGYTLKGFERSEQD